MELTTTLDCRTNLTVNYNEQGDLRVTVFATAAFLDKQDEAYDPAATTTVTVTEQDSAISEADKAALKTVLDRIAASAKDKLGVRLREAIPISRQASRQAGDRRVVAPATPSVTTESAPRRRG
jgi:hypothetical protein